MKYTAWLALAALLAALGLVSVALRGSLAVGAKAARIDLSGLASIELPRGFQLVGMVDAGDPPSDYKTDRVTRLLTDFNELKTSYAALNPLKEQIAKGDPNLTYNQETLAGITKTIEKLRADITK